MNFLNFQLKNIKNIEIGTKIKLFIKHLFFAIVTSLCLVAQVNFAFSQSAISAGLLLNGVQQFFDANGNPLSEGFVYTYIPGTFANKTTWQDAAQTTPNANPIPLNAGGYPATASEAIYGSGTYRQIVKDRNQNLIWDAVTQPGGVSVNQIFIGDGQAVGTVKQWAGITAPAQYLFAYGQTVLRSAYPDLFVAITIMQNANCTISSTTFSGIADTTQISVGASVELPTCISGTATVVSKSVNSIVLSAPSLVTTTSSMTVFPWGNGNGSTTFNIPDFRGVVLAGRPNMGGTDKGNITSTYFGANPDGLGISGGSQSQVIAQTNLPNITLPATSLHVATPVWTVGICNTIGGAGCSSGSADVVLSGTQSTTTNFFSLGTGPTFAVTGNVPLGGSATAFSLIQPTIMINYVIKVLADINTSTNPQNIVNSIGNMVGIISCGSGITCTGQTISASSISFSQITGTLGISQGGTGQITQQSALNALMPTPTNPGDLLYWNGSNWINFAGNTSTTKCASENSSGVPAWSACSAGTGTPGGSSGQFQYNSAGTFGGAATLNYAVSGDIGVGTETNPQASLSVSGNVTTGIGSFGDTISAIGVDTGFSNIGIHSYGNSVFSLLTLTRARGTAASSTALNSGDTIGDIAFTGFNGSSYASTPALMQVVANGNWTGSANGAGFKWDTTPSGTTSTAVAAQLFNGLIIGAGSIDPGAGNIILGDGTSVIYGGTNVSQNLNIVATQGTASGSEAINISSHNLTLIAPTAGNTNLVIGNSGSAAQILVSSLSGTYQTWEVPAAGNGTVIFPPTGGNLATLNNIQSFSANQYFGGGVPWFDIKSGVSGCAAAVGNGVVDDTDAIQCIVNLATSGQKIYVPNGNYCLKQSGFSHIPVTFNNRYVTFEGETEFGTQFSACGANVQLFETNASNVTMLNFSICGYGGPCDSGVSFGSNHPNIILDTLCGGCVLRNVDFIGGGQSDYIINGGASLIDNVSSQGYVFANSTGMCIWNASGFMTGTNSCDQQWPNSAHAPASLSLTSIPNWGATVTYAAGAAVLNGSYIMQAMHTSGTCVSGSGSAPSLKNYGQNITDNTCTWQTVSAANSYAVLVNSGVNELYESGFLDMAGPAGGCMNINGLSGGAITRWLHILCGGAISVGVIVSGGQNNFTNPLITSSIIKTSIGFSQVSGTAFTSITGGEITGDFGISGASGSMSISNVLVSGVSHNAIVMQLAISQFTITGTIYGGGTTFINNTAATTHCAIYANASAGSGITYGSCVGTGSNP